MIAQDSAKFWFPKLNATWLRTEMPSTVFLDYNEALLESSLYGMPTPEYERLYYAVRDAVEGEYPVFLRTDLTSAKHKGKSGCRLDNETGLNQLLLTLLSHAHLKSYHQKIKSSAIMVRPWIDLSHQRTAFGGLPIGNEFRIFADQKGVQCVHHYWPQEALVDHMDDGSAPPTWTGGWPSSWIRTDVLDAAVMAAKTMGAGKWSVDFAADVSGKFWVLDM